jgi:preprotein translocase subunit SecG
MAIALGIVLLVLAAALVALVLLQQGKDKNLSGAIAGGADTFFGKSKGANNDKLLSTVTTVVSVVFTLVVLVMPFIIK